MRNNVKIAVTGGIGSGKSTVCEIIKDLGYPVISCDEIYKTLLNHPKFLEKIAAEFGYGVIKNGELNRTKLSSIVFANEEKLKKLNDITHPDIMKKLFTQCKKHKICFCEVPLLFESGNEKNFDEVIVVLRSFDKRISSVMKKDKSSIEAVKNRIKSQFDYDNSEFAQYYVIHNDDNKMILCDKVNKALQDIMCKYEL